MKEGVWRLFTESLVHLVRICGFEYQVPRTDIFPLPVVTDGSLFKSFHIMEEAVVPFLSLTNLLQPLKV